MSPKPRHNVPLPKLASIRTLERLAVQGAHGRHWYAYAATEVAAGANRLGIDPQRFADILAITSPRVSVRKNIRTALGYVRTGSTAGTVAASRAALRHYEATGEIRGPKTSAFARAIMGDGRAIVLDVWMARAFGCDQNQFERPAVHHACRSRVRRVARKLGWTPAETQAAIWTAVATLRPGEKRASPDDKRYRTAPQFSICDEFSLFD